jgi:hypothetical protein
VTFIVIPVQAATGSPRDVEYVALLAREDLLLTLHEGPSNVLAGSPTLPELATWLPDGSISGVVSALLIALSLASLRHTAELKDRVLALEKRMDGDPGSVKVEEISERLSELLTFESIVNGQLPILQALVATESVSTWRDNAREYLACALANL